MISAPPVERVDGRDEWSWNERQVGRASTTAPSGSAERETDGTNETGEADGTDGIDRSGSPERTDTAQREVRRLEAELGALETELEQTEQRLEHVTERYERLLAKKNQQLAEQEEPAARRPPRDIVRSLFSRWIPGR